MNYWLVGGITGGVIAGAILLKGLATWASAPRCPTEAQRKKAFEDVKSGAMTAEQAHIMATSWEKGGCKADAEALRAAAGPTSVAKLAYKELLLPPAPGAPTIPGTTIVVPSTFPVTLPGGPAFSCGTTPGGREFAVDLMLTISGSSKATKEMADILTVFAQQLAFCGDMANAEKIGKRAELIRAASKDSPSVTGFGGARARNRHPLHRNRRFQLAS